MAIDVEAEFDDIEDELGLAEKRTIEEEIAFTRKYLRGELHSIKLLMGVLIFFSLMITIFFVIILFKIWYI